MWFYTLFMLFFLVGCQCSSNGTNCLAKEKTLGVLRIAREYIEEIKNILPNCDDGTDKINPSGCSKKDKALAYLEIIRDLIKEAEKNQVTCPDVTTTVTPTVRETTRYFTTPHVTTTLTPTVRKTTRFTSTPDVTTVVTTPDVTTDYLDPDEEDPNDNNPLQIKYIDCIDVQLHGFNTSGVYEIWPLNSMKPVFVYCDMHTDGGGWTVLQRRGGFPKLENFDRDWQSYKKGFGDLNGEFWLGNDYIHLISNHGQSEVRFDLVDFEGNRRYATYNTFYTENEKGLYKLTISGYKGNTGDSMNYHDGHIFSTKDRPEKLPNVETPCAIAREVGFWYNNCARVNINGLPEKGKSDFKSLHWREWRDYESLATSEMKVRRTGIKP